MISDLSPGDKLSLKGKIFELQKKLQIIDIRNKQKEEFSYKPTLYSYELPDRHGNVLESINKAEMIRKQKKQMLEAAVLQQSEEGCTFAPTITNRSKHLTKHDKRPVHVRLTDKGKVYADSIVQLREKVKKYDDNGRRLFTPSINRDNRASLDHSVVSVLSDLQEPQQTDAPPPPPLAGPRSHAAQAAADEFLYQDARDREERYRMREREQQADIEARAAASKMNASSLTLLRRRADREARAAFRCMASLGSDSGEEVSAAAAVSYCLGIDDVQSTVRAVLSGDRLSSEALGRVTSTVWALLDLEQSGSVGMRQFLAVAVPLLLHTSLSSAAQELEQVAAIASRQQGAEGEEGEWRAGHSLLASASQQDLAELQSFLRKVVAFEQKASSTKGPELAFKPHIYQHSYKLAERKERKERERIEEVLAMSRARLLLTPHTPHTPQTGDMEEEEEMEGHGEDETAGTRTRRGGEASFDRSAADADGEGGRPMSEAGHHVGGASGLSHSDIMYARALLKQQNLERIAKEAEEKAMRECTFRPKVIPPMTRLFATSALALVQPPSAGDGAMSYVAEAVDHSAADASLDSMSLAESTLTPLKDAASTPQQEQRRESVHRRLYGLKDKMKSSKLQSEPSLRMVEEMQACTFAPQMAASFARRRDAKIDAPAPPTERAQQEAERAVQRIRAVHEQRVRKAAEESHEAQQERLNQSYARSRELARKGAVPFKFVATERQESRSLEASPVRRKGEPDLIVDVKLSSAKTAKIQIWRGDDPAELASSFARIYSLDVRARDLLVSVIRQSMVDNGLLPPEEDAPYLLDDSPGAGEDSGLRRSLSRDAAEAALGQGQEAQFVDDYDSQSSVSDSNDASGSDMGSDEERDSVPSGYSTAQDSEPTA